MKRFVLLAIGVVLFVGALIVGWNFGAANAKTIDVVLPFVTVAQISVWELAIGAFGLGAGSVSLVAAFFWLRGGVLRRRYRKTIRRLESEVHQLRSLPLSDSPDPVALAEPDIVAGGRG